MSDIFSARRLKVNRIMGEGGAVAINRYETRVLASMDCLVHGVCQWTLITNSLMKKTMGKGQSGNRHQAAEGSGNDGTWC
jgi:hypothetical protein